MATDNKTTDVIYALWEELSPKWSAHAKNQYSQKILLQMLEEMDSIYSYNNRLQNYADTYLK